MKKIWGRATKGENADTPTLMHTVMPALTALNAAGAAVCFALVEFLLRRRLNLG